MRETNKIGTLKSEGFWGFVFIKRLELISSSWKLEFRHFVISTQFSDFCEPDRRIGKVTFPLLCMSVHSFSLFPPCSRPSTHILFSLLAFSFLSLFPCFICSFCCVLAPSCIELLVCLCSFYDFLLSKWLWSPEKCYFDETLLCNLNFASYSQFLIQKLCWHVFGML